MTFIILSPVASKYQVVVGGHDLTRDNGNEQRRSISTIKMVNPCMVYV